MVGIVGRSGSGKTTLVNLICRFYDVTEGRVLIDGVDVRDLSTSELRQQVGVVLQEPFLFRGTVWDNLVYGQPTASREASITATKAAQAHDFILRTPLGYDTWLGERGAGLSGGERQRLSIARALLYDPKILILDEATSSVDTESEKAIQDALKVLTRGRTTIAIAHRLTTLRDSNRILVFDQGQLIEHGSHGELMRQDGHYAKLVKIQTQLSSDASVDIVFDRGPSPAPGKEPGSEGGSDSPGTAVATDPRKSGSEKGLAEHEPRWLDPGTVELMEGRHDAIELRFADGETHRGVFAVSLFPATDPDGYVSLRTWDLDGREHEIGIVRQLADWAAAPQALIRRALGRRYFLHSVTGIDAIRLDYGYLTLQVRTTHGPASFTMRWSQSQVQDFGSLGKILIDLEENRYLVKDVESLSVRERELFLRYIYW